MLRTCLLAIAIASIQPAVTAIAQSLPEQVVLTRNFGVYDGDTFQGYEEDVEQNPAYFDSPIRIWGIEAPEDEQTCKTIAKKDWRCGHRAGSELDDILAPFTRITCKLTSKLTDETDSIPGIPYARCTYSFIGMNGQRSPETDIAAEMLSKGLVIADPKESSDEYRALEKQARDAKRGLWKGSFIMPDEWRRQHPNP